MVYILDTNILIYLIRENPIVHSELSEIGVFSPQNTTSISIASFGEVLSFAWQNNWGERKKSFLERLVFNLNPIPIFSRDLINAYAEIDTYSKGKLIERPTPIGFSARTMGKNDLWIAATTYVTKATLVSNDNDFDHLHGIYFNIIKIKSSI
jgi:tRNA(fMet)-specific endonuclease VapC